MSSYCRKDSVGLAIRARVLFPLGVTFFSKFYNPNLHNIVRSDSLGFKTKNPINIRCNLSVHYEFALVQKVHAS